MTALANALGLVLDLAIVLLAFTLIIVIHELGHFVAARWAGIRVLAFAVGFGPSLVSYRKGLGWRRGSSFGEYHALARHLDTTSQRGWLTTGDGRSISPTEYRLNALPFGGYVKMLGQDDADPSAISAEADGYQRCKPWKRMVVISAGVIFNIVSAAALFVIVFMAGLRTEPPIVGAIDPTSPAAAAVALEATDLGITTHGLQPGDRIIAIDAEPTQSFKDIVLASAMARRGDAVSLVVRREGFSSPLTFNVVPREDPISKLLQFGFGPAVSNQLINGMSARENDALRKEFDRAGYRGVDLGMRLVRINGVEPQSLGGGGNAAITAAARASAGHPLTLDFVPDDAPSAVPVSITIPTAPKLDQVRVQISPDSEAILRHVAGMTTAIQVDSVPDPKVAEATGLRAGDVFAQVGSVEWPSIAAGVAEIRRHRDSSVRIVVARPLHAAGEGAPPPTWTLVDLKQLPVNAAGQIGFTLNDADSSPLFLGSWSELPLAKPVGVDAAVPSTASAPAPAAAATDPTTDALVRLKLAPGTLLTSVAGTPVRTLGDVRAALAHAAAATDPKAQTLTVDLGVTDPFADASGALSSPPRTITWTLDRSANPADRIALQPVIWQADRAVGLFDAEQFELKASTPVAAMAMGFRETKRVVLSTYVTFLRLFQGSVKVEHLKGPVGIAHMGTMLVDRGIVWLLFFAALISVNLAVVNFLPVPITDGGHFIFLLYEQITGRPVSVAVQNAAAIVGLALVVGLFLVVTFNDISNLVGR